MSPIPELTLTDISIDVLIAVIWVIVLLRAYSALNSGKLCTRMTILTLIKMAVGGIYILQATVTLITGHRADASIWDFYNMLVLLSSYIVIEQWFRERSVEGDKELLDSYK